MKKEKTVAEIISDVVAEMCAKYCKYAHCSDEEGEKICSNCPLGKLE